MSKFKPSDFTIHSEHSGNTSDIRVVKLDTPEAPQVKQFNFERLKRAGEGEYQSVKEKFGALAATDPARAARTQKDRRFTLNPLLREPLSVEEEERRVIEEKVRARVTAMSDEAKAEAAAVGYEDGLERGYQESFGKFQGEGQGRLMLFEQFLSDMEGAKKLIYQANERFLIELIFRVARMVLLKELTTDKQYLLRLTRELVDRVGVRDNVTIKIHPEDATTAGMLKEGLEKTFGTMTNLNIEASNQVSRGGCIVETEWNAIDASIDQQLQRVWEAITGNQGGDNSIAAKAAGEGGSAGPQSA